MSTARVKGLRRQPAAWAQRHVLRASEKVACLQIAAFDKLAREEGVEVAHFRPSAQPGTEVRIPFQSSAEVYMHRVLGGGFLFKNGHR